MEAESRLDKAGLSRRNVLKLGAATAAAIGAGGLSLETLGGPRRVRAASAGEFLETSSFRVDIEGAPLASASAVSVEIEDLSIDVREMTTGADWDYRVYGPGDAHYGSATIKCRVGRNSKELLQWLQDASSGKNIRKQISVILLKRDGSEARRFNLFECFPTRWDSGDYSPSSKVMEETVTCKIGRIEFK